MSGECDTYEIKYKQVGYFENYPHLGEKVFVKTNKGIFKAIFTRWDWSDLSEDPYFEFKEGQKNEVIAWSYKKNFKE